MTNDNVLLLTSVHVDMYYLMILIFKFSMQLVFAVFTGEAWGYLGSRRFLLELDLQSNAVSGLNYSLIEKVHFCSRCYGSKLL